MRKSKYDKLAASLREKTWQRRDPDACWPFLGEITRRGSGRIWVPELKKKVLVAHAVMLVEVGEIPTGMYVLCCPKLKDCCRPEHIVFATKADIRKRVGSKLRKNWRPVRHRLSREKVREIYAATGSLDELAKTYGYSKGHITQIRNGRKYPQYTEDLRRDEQYEHSFVWP